MPAYELFCLARPTLARTDLAKIMQKVGGVVFQRGGVVTNITSYDEQPLAYKVRKSNEKYLSAYMWQMDFIVQPQVLQHISHQLKIDEGVIRFATVKRRLLPPINKELKRLVAQQQRQPASQQADIY